jgi:hypothetical protein
MANIIVVDTSVLIVTNNTGDLQNAELSFPGLAIVKPERLLRGE